MVEVTATCVPVNGARSTWCPVGYKWIAWLLESRYRALDLADSSLESVVHIVGDQGPSWERPAETSAVRYVEVRRCLP